MFSIHGPHVSILEGESGPASMIQITQILSNILFFQLLLDCRLLECEPCSSGYLLPSVFASLHQILKVDRDATPTEAAALKPEPQQNLKIFKNTHSHCSISLPML